MPADGVIAIGWGELALATLFMLVTGALSLAIGLGLVKDLAFGTVRTYLQLLALGLVLRWVFDDAAVVDRRAAPRRDDGDGHAHRAEARAGRAAAASSARRSSRWRSRPSR